MQGEVFTGPLNKAIYYDNNDHFYIVQLYI